MSSAFIGYVYETKNLVNGKFYVGLKWKQITKMGVIDPAYLGSGKILGRAIKKYGREAFSVRDLSWHDSRKDLSRAERETIAQYRQRYGAERIYNLTNGGIGGSVPGNKHGKGHRLSPEHRRAIGLASAARQWKDESRRKMSLASRGDTKGRANKGRVMSAEWRAKLAESHRGLKHSREHIANFKKSIAITWAAKGPKERKLAAERLMRPRMIKYLSQDAARAFDLIDNPLTLKALLLKAEVAEMGIPV